MRFLSRSSLLCSALVLSFACSGGGSDAPDAGIAEPDATLPDPTDALFQPDHILEVEITLSDADWAVLREQPDSLDIPKLTCGNQPTEKAYTYFPGDITVDGVTTTNVGIRKKGGFGSITSGRPGLKVKASEYFPDQRIFGSKRLTLNNNHQDPSFISQCLGYGLFSRAGVPASRCSFAHVTVNGEDLGIYSNVESIKKPMIARHFTDNTGRIYESGGDFQAGRTDGFQPKTNKEAPDCSDLPPIATALDAAPSELLSTLGELVDIDAFMTYWAMEVILDHWDGYANNRNNFFFYHDPTSDKVHMIPWGIDALFTGRQRSTRPKSVFACGHMAWRLYDAPDTQALYLAKLEELLGSVWEEDVILAEIDRMESLIESTVDPTDSGEFAAEIERVRNFVRGRSADLMAELEQGAPVWPYAEDESCLIKIGTVSGTFDTTWDTLDDFAAGTGSMSGSVAGTDVTSSTGFTSAGPTAEGQGVVRVAVQLPDGDLAFVQLIVQDLANMQPGSFTLDLRNVAAVMSFYDPDTDSAYGGGLMLGGNLTLTSASTTPDDPIVGSFTGDVIEF
jgi:spore coat protein CotH